MKKLNVMIAGLLTAALILLAGGVCAAEPDLILHNGRIVTVDAAFSIRNAMAITGGRIAAVGDNAAMLKLKGAETQLVDLHGGMILPGLIDSHMHPANASMTEFDHAIPDMESIADVLNYFRARAKATRVGEWLMLQQVFITRLRERRYPTRAELDEATSDHPVVFRTGPDASLNSLALKLAGIDRNFTIPEGTPGKIEKDARGEPTGVLRAFANYVRLPGNARMAAATREQRLARLEELLRDYRASGLTSVGDRDCGAEGMGLYQALRERGKLPVRVSLSRSVSYLKPLPEIEADIRAIAKEPLSQKRDDWLRTHAVKLYLDGGMLTGSAYMLEPWGVSEIYAIGDSAYRGTLFIPLEKLIPMVRTAVACGLQFTAHSVGDGAVHTLLDAYAAVAKEMPIRDARPCISHANFIAAPDVKRLAELGVAIDVQPAWLYLDTRTLLQHFGEGRMRAFQPLHDVFAAGAMAGGGSDHMQKIGANRSINPYSPFLGIATAVTRKAKWFDGQLNAAEALTREEALRFYTTNNAWIMFHEKELGSLEPGKLADFIAIDRDILNCPAEAIAGTKVLRTFIDGKEITRPRPGDAR